MARKDTYRPVYVPNPLSPRHMGCYCLGQRASPSPYVVTSRSCTTQAHSGPLRDGEISNGGTAARSNLPPIVPRISAFRPLSFLLYPQSPHSVEHENSPLGTVL